MKTPTRKEQFIEMQVRNKTAGKNFGKVRIWIIRQLIKFQVNNHVTN